MTFKHDNSATVDAIRADLAQYFETLHDSQLPEAGRAAILRYGATHVEPQPLQRKNQGHWGQDWHEITLLGVFAQGTTLVEALRDWTKTSLRMHLAIEEGAAA